MNININYNSISSDMWYIILPFVSRFPYEYKLVSKELYRIVNSIMIRERIYMDINFRYWDARFDLYEYTQEILYYYINTWALRDEWDYILYVLLQMRNTKLQLDILELAHLFKKRDMIDKIIEMNPNILKCPHPIIMYNHYYKNNDISTLELRELLSFALSNYKGCPTLWIGCMTPQMKKDAKGHKFGRWVYRYIATTYVNEMFPLDRNIGESELDYENRVLFSYDIDFIWDFEKNETLYRYIADMKDSMESFESIVYKLNMEEDDIQICPTWYTPDMLGNYLLHGYGRVLEYKAPGDKSKGCKFVASRRYLYNVTGDSSFLDEINEYMDKNVRNDKSEDPDFDFSDFPEFDDI